MQKEVYLARTCHHSLAKCCRLYISLAMNLLLAKTLMILVLLILHLLNLLSPNMRGCRYTQLGG